MKLEVLVGPPGSGKSTLAKRYEAEGYIRINADSQGKSHRALFAAAIAEGKPIVLDKMNAAKGQRAEWLAVAKKAGYSTGITVLHESKEVCRARCLARQGHETVKDEKDAARALSFFFSHYDRVADDEADSVVRVWPAGHKPSVVVCDLDGTLCNVDHRLHTVRGPGKKDWKSFFQGIPQDTVNSWCAAILIGISQRSGGHDVVFCSGRPDDHRAATQEWLRKHLGLLGAESPLYMRPRNDSREDSLVKEILLDFEILTRYKPDFFIDDRARVVEMYRRRGFTVLACAEGNF